MRFTKGHSGNEAGLNAEGFQVKPTLHICNKNQQNVHFFTLMI